MPKTRAKSMHSTTLDCEICGASAVHVDTKRVIEKHMKSDFCVLCRKPFKVVSVRIEHLHSAKLPAPHFGWYLTSREIAEFVIDIFIGSNKPESRALAHDKCAKRALRRWTSVARPYEAPLPKDMPFVEEAMAKMIAKGVHLKALEDLKTKLKDSLTALLKNVSGSSSEFGCPCASRVSNTLIEIADKFQNKESQ